MTTPDDDDPDHDDHDHYEDEEGDDLDEDDGEYDDVDDRQMLYEIRDRAECEGGSAWIEIAATCESVTFALEAPGILGVGCLVRVIAWEIDGAEHHTLTWIPGADLSDLRRLAPVAAPVAAPGAT